MWRRKQNGSIPDQASTSVIDQGCEFEGRFTTVGTLAVNGSFKGERLSCGTLLVGQTAELEAEIQVGMAIVSGQITGNIVATERVELKPTARIFGNIVTPVLVLEEGVLFEGHCKMNGNGSTQFLKQRNTE